MRLRRLIVIGLVALGGASCASGPASAPAGVDVTGKWQGAWQFQNASLGGGQVTMTLTQSGSKASGNMVVTGAPVDRTGAVSALVTGNELYFVYPTGITGYLTISGDEMKGQLDGMNPGNVTLRRQR